jgi:hypothetical protein
VLLAWAVMPAGAFAQAPSIRDWDLVCFCNSRVRTPHFIVKMDNNGAILYAARSGVTREGLQRAGIRASESQLRLLEDWSLLLDSGGVLRTAFPVLPPGQTSRLRAALREAARTSVPRIRPSLDTLTGLIASQADSAAAWATIFSYVLDGLVWDSLSGGTDLVATDITVAKPYWNGGFWAIAPKRINAPGTNSGRVDDSTSILMAWTPGTLARFQPLQRTEGRVALLRALRGNPASLSPDIASLGLLRADGSPAVVVVRSHDPLAVTAHALAGVVARDFTTWMRTTNLPRQIGVQDAGLATLVGYHEYMWELLDALVDNGILAVPEAVARTDAPLSEMRRLITIVVK